jgi:hypothetical protein
VMRVLRRRPGSRDGCYDLDFSRLQSFCKNKELAISAERLCHDFELKEHS